MNVRGYRLAIRLGAILDTLLGATAISFHRAEGWTIVLIAAASDEAVTRLGEELGASEVRAVGGRWWRRCDVGAEAGHGHASRGGGRSASPGAAAG